LNKEFILNILNKYYLDGFVEQVKWIIKDKNLIIKFTTPTKDLIGVLEITNIDLPDSEIVISDTTQLIKLISILDNEFSFSLKEDNGFYSKIVCKDSNYQLLYSLGHSFLLDELSEVEEPLYEICTDFDKEFVNKFIKARKALTSDTSQLYITQIYDKNHKPLLAFYLGNEGEYSNKIAFTLSLETSTIPFDNLFFNIDMIKSILNNMGEGKLEINTEGLIKFHNEYELEDNKLLKIKYFCLPKN